MQISKGVSFTGLQLFAAEYGSGSQLRENFISHRPMIYFSLVDSHGTLNLKANFNILLHCSQDLSELFYYSVLDVARIGTHEGNSRMT